ncbi:hypothetical protein [Sphingosinicella soli]|uniref:Uncharacterized protein n=1 Tax=Sphingosinicella soli TaxID=333708 RepID=A0A7W7B3D3_9SPHN|nr:hypothetical protein [Sphingosinicella soli]MBB4633279.1 hypothetical protein [Sphingosinicella soli]
MRSGYLKRADSILALAAMGGIGPEGLERTVQRFNEHAVQGKDPEFGRGESVYDIANGDPDHKPNPRMTFWLSGRETRAASTKPLINRWEQ